MTKATLMKLGAGVMAAGLMLGVVACSDDDDDPGSPPAAATDPPSATATPTIETTGATGPAGATGATGPTGTAGTQPETIEVTAVDYEFEGLPDTIDAGSRIEMSNDSDEEVHELVAILLPQSETRSVEELLELPEEELGELGNIEPSLVLVAAPGEDATAVLGTGTLTQPGRYLVACFIPVGADPDAVIRAMQGATEQPEIEGGPPHYTEGMYAELNVE